MIWSFDYEPLFTSLVMASGNKSTNMDKAYKRAQEHFDDFDFENYIIINVEGYSCIAHITDHFTPIEISRDIFPFDKENVYPMQGLKIEPRFMTWKECMEED